MAGRQAGRQAGDAEMRQWTNLRAGMMQSSSTSSQAGGNSSCMAACRGTLRNHCNMRRWLGVAAAAQPHRMWHRGSMAMGSGRRILQTGMTHCMDAAVLAQPAGCGREDAASVTTGSSCRTLQKAIRVCEKAPLITQPAPHMWHRGLMGISNGRRTLQAGMGVSEAAAACALADTEALLHYHLIGKTRDAN